MSVADRLGTGSSFGKLPRSSTRSARGRAKAVAQGDVPTYELVRLPLDEVAPTPLNPRRNFGDDTAKTAFGEKLRSQQLSACVVVSREAYLALWPEHAEVIGEARAVLLNGERRWRSAAHVGLETLDFVFRDDLARTREDFVDNLLQENLDREDFDVIERARGVAQLVEECGDRITAAQRLNRDKSWVTNQLALLTLPEEIQGLLTAGQMPERDGRWLARRLKEQPELGTADLQNLWEQFKADQAKERDEKKAILAEARTRKQLSADNRTNKQPLPEPDSEQGAPAGENRTSLRTAAEPNEKQARVPHSTERTPQDELSADNRPDRAPLPHQAKPTPEETTPEQASVQLNLPPEQLAAALAAALPNEDLLALVEALHAYV